MPKNINIKSLLRIGGKMSEKGADKAGMILAKCLGMAEVLASMATVIWAVRWW